MLLGYLFRGLKLRYLFLMSSRVPSSGYSIIVSCKYCVKKYCILQVHKYLGTKSCTTCFTVNSLTFQEILKSLRFKCNTSMTFCGRDTNLRSSLQMPEKRKEDSREAHVMSAFNQNLWEVKKLNRVTGAEERDMTFGSQSCHSSISLLSLMTQITPLIFLL